MSVTNSLVTRLGPRQPDTCSETVAVRRAPSDANASTERTTKDISLVYGH